MPGNLAKKKRHTQCWCLSRPRRYTGITAHRCRIYACTSRRKEWGSLIGGFASATSLPGFWISCQSHPSSINCVVFGCSQQQPTIPWKVVHGGVYQCALHRPLSYIRMCLMRKADPRFRYFLWLLVAAMEVKSLISKYALGHWREIIFTMKFLRCAM